MVDTRALRARATIAAWRFESSPRHKTFRGMAQLVERLVWDEEVARSNRATPTSFGIILQRGISSAVERNFSKVDVRGSTPLSRSNYLLLTTTLINKVKKIISITNTTKPSIANIKLFVKTPVKRFERLWNINLIVMGK